MIGKFLLGMVSGGLLVTGGLVVGTALFPVKPANDNPAVAEEPVKAPEPTSVEAQPKATEPVEAEADPVVKEAAPAEASAVVDEPEPPETEADASVAEEKAQSDTQTDTQTEAALAETETPPEVAAAKISPDAPAETGAAPETAAVTPELAEVAAPETPAEPPKPPVAEADIAAAQPEAAPPKPEVAAVAEVKPEPAPVEPAPVEPAPVEPAPVEPAPVETAEVAPAEVAEAPEPVEVATPEPAEAPEAAEVVPEPATEATESAEAAPDAMPVAEEPAAETAEVAPESVPEPTPELQPETTPDPVAPAAEEPPMVTEAEPRAETLPDAGADSMPGKKPAALPGTEVEVAEAEPESGSTFTPAPSLIEGGEGVIVGRLPKVGEDVAEVADETPASVDPRPIAVNAAAFENPDAKPGFAIVLIDMGQADLDRAGLAALPFPVSFALDPLDPATPERAALYRAAGKEVIMIATGIAEGAQASDVEVAFQSMEQNLPEAVAVMDLPVPQFQNNRLLSSAVIPILKAQGRGLLTWDEGLNAADQVARRDDVEAAVVFRDLGSAGGDRVAIRRILDRAVFKAAQDGRVSVVGEADAETVAALLEWTVEGKAATVALAPVTAILTVD